MALFSRSSSLTASDENRDDSGLMQTTPTRISKQHIQEHKMFGRKRKGIQIGKKFRMTSKKDAARKPRTPHMQKRMGISPSLAEFDRMMDGVAKSSKSSSGFSRKQFG